MNGFNSIFCQILQLFSKREFFEAVHATQSERGAKGFSCWDQFVAMLFCQLGQAHSLREICGGLGGCFGKAKHLGLRKAPKRSTLSYANEHRPWQLYERIFYQFLGRCQSVTLHFILHHFRRLDRCFAIRHAIMYLIVIFNNILMQAQHKSAKPYCQGHACFAGFLRKPLTAKALCGFTLGLMMNEFIFAKNANMSDESMLTEAI